MRISIIVFLAFSIFAIGTLTPAGAHCDTMDGPVVKAAQKSLDTGNVNYTLIWVPEGNETQIKEAFNKTLEVRKLSPEAKDLADMYFFETVVRIHRESEGETYTGLKPAGTDLGPIIPAADRALENNSSKELVQLLTDAVQNGTLEEYDKAIAKKNFNPDNVKAGREYIEVYVPFVHYVERIYEAAATPVEGHYTEEEHTEGEHIEEEHTEEEHAEDEQLH